MPDEAVHVAEQFDDARQQREAATAGMWIFLGTEVLLFGGLLTGYLVYRIRFPEVFSEASGHLDLLLGSINTGVLLTSSLTMALADAAVNARRRGATIGLLAATASLGAVFLAIKGYEWYQEALHDLVPVAGQPFHFPGAEPQHAQMFFNLYFTMTGLHATHLLVGILIVLTMLFLALRSHPWGRLRRRIELTGLYWHFVDVVWVFLFPLLYLI